MKSRHDRLTPRPPLPKLDYGQSLPNNDKIAGETVAAPTPHISQENTPRASVISHSIANSDVLQYDLELHLGEIDVSPYQPRLVFDESEIHALAESIDDVGLINPITVRKQQNGRYELISGERRFRAHQILRKLTIKAKLRVLSDEEASLEALVDNEARKDLCDYERGKSFRRILDAGTVKDQAKLSRKLGVPKSTISRCLAFFKLPVEAQELLDLKPAMLGGTNAEVLAAFVVNGHREIVENAVKLLHDKDISEQAAVNWAKSEVRKLTQKLLNIKPRQLVFDGRHLADITVDGRKVVIACQKGVNPEDLILRLSTVFGPA